MTEAWLTHDGITQPVTEWALDYGIYPKVITDRLAGGWSVDRAITTPMATAPCQRLKVEHLPNLPPLRAQRRRRTPGVAKNLASLMGTGGGSVAQDIPQIEISNVTT